MKNVLLGSLLSCILVGQVTCAEREDRFEPVEFVEDSSANTYRVKGSRGNEEIEITAYCFLRKESPERVCDDFRGFEEVTNKKERPSLFRYTTIFNTYNEAEKLYQRLKQQYEAEQLGLKPMLVAPMIMICSGSTIKFKESQLFDPEKVGSMTAEEKAYNQEREERLEREDWAKRHILDLE